MPRDTIQRPEIAYLVQNVLPVLHSQYDFPAPEDETQTQICTIPVRMGSSTKKPDVVYYYKDIPVFLVEAKREDKSEEDAIGQALSYIRNYPVERYSKDGVKPRLFAVTIGRQISFYKHSYEIDENGVFHDWPDKLDRYLHFEEILKEYGLIRIEKKKIIGADEFRKEIINELVAIYKQPNDDRITPEVVFNVSHQLLSVLRDSQDYVSRQPYVSLDKRKDMQVHIRQIFNKYDLLASIGPELAKEFRSFILRSFQGGVFNQYLTEQCVIAFMMDMVGNIQSETSVLDFECGSGGFLAATVDKRNVPLENVRGVDIDELPYVIAKTYMAIYFKRTGNEAVDAIPIINGNGLLTQGGDWDLVIGNPAGSSKYEHGDLDEVLENLDRDLDQNERDDKFSEYNFSIQQAVQSAKVGGKICIILPEGVFSNSNDECLRRYLIKHCKILAIIGLPRGAFKRGTSTRRQQGGSQTATMKMSILYAVKEREVTYSVDSDENIDLNYPVFLAQIGEPESASGQICDWLEPRLNIVFDQWKEWQNNISLLNAPVAKIKDSLPPEKSQKQQELILSEKTTTPEKSKELKSDTKISKHLKGLFNGK